MKKVLSMLIVLSLVMSLFSGFVAAPKSVSAAEGAGPAPVVNIVYAPSSVDVGDDFYVNAVVANAAGGTATILPLPSGVKLAAGETDPKNVGTDCVGDVWWKLTCIAAEVSRITVTSGLASDYVMVTQGEPADDESADFTITWVETPCFPESSPFIVPGDGVIVPVGTLFSVKASIHYSGDGLTEPVSLKLNLGPGLAFELSTPADGIIAVGPMSSSRDEIAAWNIKCTAISEHTFVAVALALPEGVTADVPDPCYFDQGEPTPPVVTGNWDAEVYSPEEVAVNCGANLWDVRTTLRSVSIVHSVGQVYAKLTILFNNPVLAVLGTGELSLKVMTGTNPIPAGGGTAEATWNLVAMQPGEAKFKIEYYDYGTSTTIPFLTKTFSVWVKNYIVTIGDLATGMITDPNNPGNLIPDPYQSVYAYVDDPYQYVVTNAAEIASGIDAYWADDNPIIEAETEECKLFTVKTTFENAICFPIGDGVVDWVRVHVQLPDSVIIAPQNPANPLDVDWRPIHVAEYVRNQTTGEVSAKMDANGNPVAYDMPVSAVQDGYLRLPTNCACCIYVITWKLQCVGSSEQSPVTFTAEVWNSGGLSYVLDDAYFLLTQVSAPHVLTSASFYQGWLSTNDLTTNETTVVAAPCVPVTNGEYDVSNKWTLVIPVINTGDVAVNNLHVLGTLTGAYLGKRWGVITEVGNVVWQQGDFSGQPQLLDFPVGTLAGHTAVKLLVEAYCTGDANVAFTFTGVTGEDSLVLTDVVGEGTNAITQANITTWYDYAGVQYLDTGVQIDFDILPIASITSIKFTIFNGSTVWGTRTSTGTDLVTLLQDSGQYWGQPVGTYLGTTGQQWLSSAFTTRATLSDNGYWVSSPSSILPGQFPTSVVVEIQAGDTTYVMDNLGSGGVFLTTGTPFTNLTNGVCGPYVCMPNHAYDLAQIPFTFTILEPLPQERKMVSSNYAVKILVTYCGTDPLEALSGLTATLSIKGNAELTNGDFAIHQLGELNSTRPNAETAWNVHCTGIDRGSLLDSIGIDPGGSSTIFTVTLAATTPVFSMTQSVTVEQTASSSVDVDILSPMELSRYATGQPFAISAKVCVPFDAAESATGLDVHLFSNYGLEVITAPVIATTMQPGECKTYTWTVRLSLGHDMEILFAEAVGPGGPLLPPDLAIIGGFQIHVTGDNIAPAQDMEPLVFYKAAYLITTITGLTDAAGVPITDEHPVIPGSEFYVCGTIANIGWADATSVNIHAGVLYGDVAPAPGSMAYDYFVGTVPAQRGDPTVPANQFCIKLQCEKAGKTSIALTTSGEDEYGIHWDVIEQRLIVTPLNPIPVNHLENHFGSHEPEAITFVQADIVPPVDITAPVITPTAGQDGAIVNDPHFTLTGTVTDNVGVTSFFINDVAVGVMPDTTFAYPVVLAVGDNVFAYKAFDAAGNISLPTSITVHYVVLPDMTPPVITPTAGQDGAIVNDPHFTLSGRVTDNVGVTSFFINELPVGLLLDGRFAYPVVLVVGANTFTYKAFDAASNMATTSITVTYVVPVDPLLKTVALSYIEGWNLVTVPLDSTTLSGLAGNPDFTGEIYGYSQTTGWFIPTGFEAGQGYWLNMKAAGTATIYGYEVASPQVTNYASGWVLIGSPYSVGGDTVKVIVGVNPPMLLEDAVASTFIGNIFYFDGTWGAFDATIDTIQPGLGYWVELKVGASIVFLKP